MIMAPSINHRGMTLLEILVVVAILGVLIALLLPSMRGMIEQANTANCMGQIRQFGVGALAFSSDHDGFLPPGRLVKPMTSENSNPQTGVNIANDLQEGGYLPELPYCPSLRLTEKGREYIANKKISLKQHFQSRGSYGINMFLTQTKLAGLPGPYWPKTIPYPGNARMPFVIESYVTALVWSFSQVKYALDGIDSGGIYAQPRNHGNHRLHFMFVDGHIELLGPRVTSGGDSNSYDWSGHFNSWGEDGKFPTMRRAFTGD